MSLRNTLRALPAMARVSALEALAYRGELLVWILATTMPLVMMAIFAAVAREAPLGRYTEREAVLYFLLAFVVRQLTGSWVAWQMNSEIREGALTLRLLRPVSPIVGYAVGTLANLPLRLLAALPVAVLAILFVGADRLPSDPVLWLVFLLSLAGGWLITFLSNVIIGAMSFFMESSLSLMDVWLVLFFVLSGYTIPVDLFPPWLGAASEWLPFRYQMAFPIEVLTAGLGRHQALTMLARQAAMASALALLAAALWRRGLARFEAYGG